MPFLRNPFSGAVSMRRRLIFALFLIAAVYGCSQTPVQPNAREARPVADGVPGDSALRGGNVMGGGH
jgi:hypothetical protein